MARDPRSFHVMAVAALAASFGAWPWMAAFGLALASEALDRAAFHAALEPSTPASRMEAEARTKLGRSQN